MEKTLFLISVLLLVGSYSQSLMSQNLQLEYSIYLGGNQNDQANGMAIDSTGSVYLAGWTASADFPTANPYQSTLSEGMNTKDIFISRLSQPSSRRRYVFESGDNRDGTSDTGIFRDTSGLWAIRGITRPYFGISGDIPVTR